MNLREWSTLTVEERKTWLETQSPRKLTELLATLNEMLIEADEMDAQIATIGEPSIDIINARDFTYNTLRDAENYIVIELHNRQHIV